MVSKTPNEEERKKLQKMAKYNSLILLYLTILLGLIFINNFFLGQYPFLQMSVAIILSVAMIIFLLMGVFLFKRCPRCSSWGTPVTGGNCPKCGLHLDPSDNGNKKTHNQSINPPGR